MALNFWSRLLPRSSTQMLPPESTAASAGRLSWPLPEPLLPNEEVWETSCGVVKTWSGPWVVPYSFVAVIRQ